MLSLEPVPLRSYCCPDTKLKILPKPVQFGFCTQRAIVDTLRRGIAGLPLRLLIRMGVDVKRDYYADLGLTPEADDDALKKQFKKLALQYHPDRHPGKGSEYLNEFQVIQAAYEILSDRGTRLKYDADRLRKGYYKPQRESGSESSKPRTFTRFPGGGTSVFNQPRPFRNGAFTGSSSFAFAGTAGRQSTHKMGNRGQGRANASASFGKMKDNTTPFDKSQKEPGSFGTVPNSCNTTRGRPTKPTFTDRNERSTGTQPTPGRRGKSKGFKPHVAGGDEPMATNASYTQSTRSEGQRSSTDSPAGAKCTSRSQNSSEDSSSLKSGGASSAYASKGGKNDFSSTGSLGHGTNPPSAFKPPHTGNKPVRGPSFTESASQKTSYQSDPAPKMSDMAGAEAISQTCLNKDTLPSQSHRTDAIPERELKGKERIIPQPASVTTEDEDAEPLVGRSRKEKARAVGSIDDQQSSMEDIWSEHLGSTKKPTSVKNSQKDRSPPVASQRTSRSRLEDEPMNAPQAGMTGASSSALGQDSELANIQFFCTVFQFKASTRVLSATLNRILSRELSCPKTRVLPQPPQYVPISTNTQGLEACAMRDKYLVEMNAYLKDWNRFQRQVLSHFLAHHSNRGTTVRGIDKHRDCCSEGESGDRSQSCGLQNNLVQKFWVVANQKHVDNLLRHEKVLISFLRESTSS